MPLLSLDALQVLDAIDSKGSFAAAGRYLNKVPSAITYTVHKLEDDLGITLFTRVGRRSKLTPAGKLLLNQGREILKATAQLVETARQVDSGWESVLNIAVDTALGTEHLYPAIQALFEMKPDIEVNLFEEALGGGWEALQTGKTDIAIGLPGPFAGKSEFQCVPYVTSEWRFYTASHHPLSQKDRVIQKSDIESLRNVVIRDSARHQAGMSIRLFSNQPLLRVQSMRDKLSAQIAGLGVGFLPKNLARPFVEKGLLIEKTIADTEVNTTFYMAWRKGKNGKALRFLIDKLDIIRKDNGRASASIEPG